MEANDLQDYILTKTLYLISEKTLGVFQNNAIFIKNMIDYSNYINRMVKTKIVKSEVEALEREEANGAIIRSKARWAEAGERYTKYFLNLEKRNAINQNIVKCQVTIIL